MELSYLFYIVMVGLMGSSVSFLHNPNKSFRGFLNRVFEGCFVAYIVYEISFFNFHNTRLSLSLCGFGAWMGSDGLIFIRDIVTDFFKKKV
ncbi:hypothetical protein CPIN18021_1097 [Campylobacter pinnipediorum subsp. caledonicus]|uniref:Uncharacterized protein n=1 Tax=Campylobacter pinnipediorum subsp. caledonicus TaxID=1874362 RepID=A0A1S6U823_9BACT|nr:hypothetical protein [Campylobacter pinnipediorum]AQW85484.1 hypothetical protein CPIN18020_0237 [Campylobacter pinnipediorum subsp. caledonicus]AQW87896.1 hypothetical protein CPIN18021_1097 [Campylobacter pinnipediorum subsp. caledonicus]